MLVLVSETVDARQVLSAHNGVRLLWVPGHCNIVGNERADQLAKQAAATGFIGPEAVLDLDLSVDSVQLLIHRWAVNEQIKLWQQHSHHCDDADAFLVPCCRGDGDFVLESCRCDGDSS